MCPFDFGCSEFRDSQLSARLLSGCLTDHRLWSLIRNVWTNRTNRTNRTKLESKWAIIKANIGNQLHSSFILKINSCIENWLRIQNWLRDLNLLQRFDSMIHFWSIFFFKQESRFRDDFFFFIDEFSLLDC